MQRVSIMWNARMGAPARGSPARAVTVVALLATATSLYCSPPPANARRSDRAPTARTAASESLGDSACASAIYHVDYREHVSDSKPLTDSFEQRYGLLVLWRGLRRDGTQAAFGAVMTPAVAREIARHPDVLRVQRGTHSCKARVLPPRPWLSRRDGPPKSVPRAPVELRPLPTGAIRDPWTSELDSLRAVVRSPTHWSALWPAPVPRYPMPPVDFKREMILVAAAGDRGGHGHTIRIDSAFVAGDTLFAVVREYYSGRTCGTTGMVVRPIHAVRVDRRAEWPVVFLERGRAEVLCRR